MVVSVLLCVREKRRERDSGRWIGGGVGGGPDSRSLCCLPHSLPPRITEGTREFGRRFPRPLSPPGWLIITLPPLRSFSITFALLFWPVCPTAAVEGERLPPARVRWNTGGCQARLSSPNWETTHGGAVVVGKRLRNRTQPAVIRGRTAPRIMRIQLPTRRYLRN